MSTDGTAPPTPQRVGNCLFEEDWWLDAVAPGLWGRADVRSGGSVQATLSYSLARKFGFTFIRQPPLTQTLGPWYKEGEGKRSTRLGREKDLAEALLAQLPKHDFFSQNFHHTITNWLPFFWQGFSAVPRVTYVLDNLLDEHALWNNLQENIRREIRKAQQRVEVISAEDPEQFLDVHEKTFQRQDAELPYSREAVRRVDAACASRGARRIYLAVDEQQQVHAGAFVVFDERCAYYLMGGGNPALRNSGAGSLIMWRAIVEASRTSAAFDFEGSMSEPIERFFRAFGARQAPYLNVRKSSRAIGFAQGLRAATRSLSSR